MPIDRRKARSTLSSNSAKGQTHRRGPLRLEEEDPLNATLSGKGYSNSQVQKIQRTFKISGVPSSFIDIAVRLQDALPTTAQGWVESYGVYVICGHDVKLTGLVLSYGLSESDLASLSSSGVEITKENVSTLGSLHKRAGTLPYSPLESVGKVESFRDGLDAKRKNLTL